MTAEDIYRASCHGGALACGQCLVNEATTIRTKGSGIRVEGVESRTYGYRGWNVKFRDKGFQMSIWGLGLLKMEDP